MKQTTLARGGQQPAVTGGTEATLRHVHDGGPVLSGDLRRSRRRNRCRRRSAGIPGGILASTHGQGRGLVEARQHDVDQHGPDVSRATATIDPYEL